MRLVLGLTSVLAIGAAPAAAAEPVDLIPSGPWKVDYADDNCNLSRPLTAAGRSYHFALVAVPVNKGATVRVTSLETVKERQDGEARVQIDGSALKAPVDFTLYPGAKGVAVRRYAFHSRVVLASGQRLRLNAGRGGDLVLNLLEFPKAMQAMDSCVDHLHTSMGIDPALVKQVATPPDGRTLSFVSVPASNLQLKLLYWVNSQGRVDECRVLSSSRLDLKDSICADLVKRGRFKPARSMTGAPIRAPVYEDIDIVTRTSLEGVNL